MQIQKQKYNETFRKFFSKFEKQYNIANKEEKEFLWDLAVDFVERNRDFVMQYPLVDYWDTYDNKTDFYPSYKNKNVNLYFHIPFCKTRCTYCNFHIVVGDKAKDLQRKMYIQKIKKEIDVFLINVGDFNVTSIFIGGGTPSYLEVDDINILFSYIQEKLGPFFDPNIEFSFEGNPDSFSLEKLKLLKKYGINRISFGVQTFDNDIIKKVNRTYTEEIIYGAINDSHTAGISNINIDMIYGLPGHNYEIMKSDLIKASQLDITHLTYYPLYYYDEATLSKAGNREDNIQQIYHFYDEVISTLQKSGFHQYGREYFCKNNLKHNYQSNFVSNKLLYGFGHSAYSFNGKHAFYKKQDLKNYLTSQKNIEKFYTYNNEDSDRRLFVLGGRNIVIEKKNISNIKKTSLFIALAIKLKLIIENKQNFTLTKKGLKYQEILAHMFV